MRLTGFDIAIVQLHERSADHGGDLPIRIGASRNLLVRVEDETGRVGWGETAPRLGIKCETIESARACLHEDVLPPLLGLELESFEQVAAAMERLLDGRAPHELTGFCAAELAVLDLAGRRFGRAAGDVLGPPRRDAVHYSGIIDARDPGAVRDQAAALRRSGAGSVRIRMGIDLERNLGRLDITRQILGNEVELLADPEQRWDRSQTLTQLAAMARFRLAGVEQPVPAGDMQGLSAITAAGLVPVIAAGQVQTPEDVAELVAARACDSVNIRIAHCGGLLGAARVHAAARRAGLGCLLGAPRQEIGLLAAAGRQFGLRAEGVHWLDECAAMARSSRPVCQPPMAAGPGGLGPAPTGPGLGTCPDPERLEPLIRQKISVH